MSEFYYLISSLPMLKLGEIPLIDSKEFLDSCSRSLNQTQLRDLSSVSLVPNDSENSDSCLEDWMSWEIILRNHILRKRSKNEFENPEKYLREEYDFFLEIEKGVQKAFSKKTPLEREEHFDFLRWRKLEDMEIGHQFDFKQLCIYRIKLLLCEKTLERNKDKGSQNYDEIVNEIYGLDPLAPPQSEENSGED